jgi:hypothetical protein
MGSIDRERVKLDLIKIIAEELEIDPDIDLQKKFLGFRSFF